MTTGPIPSRYEVDDLEFRMVAEGRIRIWIGLVVFSVALLLIVLRLAEVALFTQPPGLGASSEEDVVFRADIEDRNGQLLATTINNYALYAKPSKILNKREAVSGVLSLFPHLDEADLDRRVRLPRDEVRLARGLTPTQKNEVIASGLPGLFTKAQFMRSYPNGAAASHVLGLVDIDLNPMSGIEYSFNEDIVAEDAPPKALSIDLRVQSVLEDELFKTVTKFSADTGAGIVLDIKTGEVLAMASLPEYDPNQRDTISPQKEKNTATNATYDLGSVFKPLTVAMALDRGVTTLDEAFPVHKPFTVQKKLIRDDHESKVPYDAAHILSESSNRGTALMALRAGADMQQDFFKAVGLFDRSPIELNGLARPQYHKEWQDISIVTTSYGHGISVTPLHLASAIGAILNDGVYVAPTLAKVDSAHKPATRRVISSRTSKDVAELMRFVVTDGTGRSAEVPGLGVMGKTGTADKPSVGGYDTRRLVTSFVGAFPVWDPKYVVMITLDEPKALEETHGFATAGWNAAPTAGRVMSRIAPMVDVPVKPIQSASSFVDREALQ
ncbi:MAG: penicillin-binding protein 2 [Maricaulaceae bacterium]